MPQLQATQIPQVQIIPKDSVCHVVEEATLDNGKERFRIVAPVEGWITKTQVQRTVIEAK